MDETRQGETNDMDVLDGLQPHSSLESLEILGYGGTEFPLWTMKMALRNEIEGSWVRLDKLIKITISNCDKCEEIPMLGHLQNLRFLKLNGLSNVRFIGLSFYGIERFSASSMISDGNCQQKPTSFPALEMLHLSDMKSLTEWLEVEGSCTVFPHLELLKIESCPNFQSLPSHFPCLKKLIVSELGTDFSLSNVCSNTSFR